MCQIWKLVVVLHYCVCVCVCPELPPSIQYTPRLKLLCHAPPPPNPPGPWNVIHVC